MSMCAFSFPLPLSFSLTHPLVLHTCSFPPLSLPLMHTLLSLVQVMTHLHSVSVYACGRPPVCSHLLTLTRTPLPPLLLFHASVSTRLLDPVHVFTLLCVCLPTQAYVPHLSHACLLAVFLSLLYLTCILPFTFYFYFFRSTWNYSGFLLSVRSMPYSSPGVLLCA